MKIKPHFPRFVPWRFSDAGVDSLVMPASENLHKKRQKTLVGTWVKCVRR
jgi:hypothetical protein